MSATGSWRRRLPVPGLAGRSLLGRVMAVHALGLAATALLTLGTADAVLELRTRIIEHRVLLGQADGIRDGLSLNATRRLQIDYAHTPLSQSDQRLFVFAVVNDQGRVQLSTTDAVGRRLSRLRRAPRVRFLTLKRLGPTLATITKPIIVDGTPFWLMVGWNLSDPGVIFDNILSGFFGYAAAVALIVLVMLLSLDLVIMRDLLQPVLRVIAAVRLSHRSGDEWRLSLDELPQEIVPLANAYNEALDKVEAAYRLQREFVADAAHELRTPIAVLHARLETLTQLESRNLLLADVTVMTRIVSQLLEIASLERLVVDATASADPAAVCAAVVEALAPMAIAARRDLGLTVAENAPVRHLRIRDQELFQVVRNLVENAINHTKDGTTIDVRVQADGAIVVLDDGPGIPVDLHKVVFERFWRRDRRDRKGSGLGLAIVQRIVAAHGGSITLESDEGAGCSFTIRLPTTA
ncbi:MAG: sensor histidine kinase [Janthinobacterium lividum]